MDKDVIKELNTFLEGNFMAIHAYDKYIHRIDNVDIKRLLQTIQQSHKRHAAMIAERIQNLGGAPVDDVGFMGNVAEMLSSFRKTDGANDILKDALVGEERGIKKSKELLDGDLDPESRELVKRILEADEQHIELLDKTLH